MVKWAIYLFTHLCWSCMPVWLVWRRSHVEGSVNQLRSSVVLTQSRLDGIQDKTRSIHIRFQHRLVITMRLSDRGRSCLVQSTLRWECHDVCRIMWCILAVKGLTRSRQCHIFHPTKKPIVCVCMCVCVCVCVCVGWGFGVHVCAFMCMYACVST